METSQSSSQANVKSCVCAGVIPCSSTGCINNSFSAEDLGVLLDKKLNMNQQYVLAKKKANWFVSAKA